MSTKRNKLTRKRRGKEKGIRERHNIISHFSSFDGSGGGTRNDRENLPRPSEGHVPATLLLVFSSPSDSRRCDFCHSALPEREGTCSTLESFSADSLLQRNLERRKSESESERNAASLLDLVLVLAWTTSQASEHRRCVISLVRDSSAT